MEGEKVPVIGAKDGTAQQQTDPYWIGLAKGLTRIAGREIDFIGGAELIEIS